MKKEDVVGLIIYMLIIALAIVYSLTVLRTHFDHSNIPTAIAYAGFVIGALVVGIVTTGILLELGHVLGAKAGKYSIISICVLFFTLFKTEEGKWKFRLKNFDGLTGETKILPKGKDSTPIPFLWFGTLFLAIWGIACFVIFFMFNTNDRASSDLAYFFLTVAVVVFTCLIYNILPIKLDSRTDGYALRMMSNPRNKYAFNEMLRIQHEVEQGNNDVEIETFTELTNYTAELNMNKVYVLLDKKEYEEADKILDIVLANKEHVSYKIYLRSLAMKIFNKVIISTPEEATKYLNENVTMDLRREFSSDTSLMSIRAYILLEALTDNSKSECLLAINKVNSAYKSVHKNRRRSESEMYNAAIDYVCKVHPKWEFEQYKIMLEEVEEKKNDDKTNDEGK